MRTLKKTLCLVLAIVMILGLGVFSVASAADETAGYETAKAVTTAVKIFRGDENGALNWTQGLTRAQAAVVLTTLKGMNASVLPTGSPYADMVGHWADKYVNYASSEGLVVGWDGKFDPDAPLTGYQWALMLLRVLGYSDSNEGIGGQGWEVRVATVARNAGLDDELTMSSEQITRAESAQYVLNALKSPTVEYTGGTNITVGDTTITQGATRQYVIATAATDGTYTSAISGDDATVGGATRDMIELGEQLYGGKLAYAANAGSDDFGNPKSAWIYDTTATKATNAAATQAKTDLAIAMSDAETTGAPVATFTAGTKAAAVVTALKGYKVYVDINNTNATDDEAGQGYQSITNTATTYTANTELTTAAKAGLLVINGAAAIKLQTQTAKDSIAKTIADLTANGRVVKIYADDDNHITRVVVDIYTVAKVDTVTSTTKNGNVLTTYKLNNTNGGTATVKAYSTIADEDTATEGNAKLEGSIAKGDYVTYYISRGANADYDYYVYPTAKVTGAQSAITSAGVATIGGSSYTVGLGVEDTAVNLNTQALVIAKATNYLEVANFSNSNDEANYYLDQFGYVVATSAISATTNYAVINRIAMIGTSGTAGNKGLEAILILPDGTTPTVQVSKIGGIKVADVNPAAPQLITDQTKITAISISDAYATNTPDFEDVIVTYEVDSNGKYELEFPNLAPNNNTNNTGAIRAVLDQRVKTTTSSDATAAKIVTLTTKGAAMVTGYNQTDASAGTLVGNDSTMYVIKTANASGTWSYKAYTGYASIPSIKISNGTAVVSYAAKNGSTKFVYIEVPYAASNTTGDSTTGTFAVLNSKSYEEIGTGASKYYEFSLIVDGVAGSSVKTKTAAVFNVLSNTGALNDLYELTVDNDGYVTALTLQNANNGSLKFNKSDAGNGTTDKAADGVLTITGTTPNTVFNYSGSTKVYVIDGNSHELIEGAEITTFDEGDIVYVKVVDKNATDAKATTADTVYIIKLDA